MQKSKWIATVASIWIQCSCGPSYAFGIYSAVLKSSQDYDQSTLDTVSVFKDIGANIGILSGLLYHAVTYNNRTNSTSRFGGSAGLPLVYLAGAVQFFAGYFLMWLSVTGVINKPPVLVMCLFMFMGAHAQTFFNTANIVVAVQNFPDYSGTTVGVMKGFLGLSGAILIQVYSTLFDGNPTSFLLMLAFFPTLVSLLLMFFVHINPGDTTNDKHHLNDFSLIALIVAAYLMIIIIFENIFTFPSWAHILATTILFILLSSPLKVALAAQKGEQQTPPPIMAPLIITSETNEGVPNDVQVEMNLLQAMGTINFWLLFVPMVFGMGSGLATINNISQIGQSLDYSTAEINAMVSLWSIWNFLGRFGGGFVSDIFLHRYGWGRPVFISITQATMVIGHLIIGLGGNLYIGSVIVGICYGSQWSLMPTITSDIFGVKHMGTIFNTIAAANPIGSYLLSVQVIGSIYDKETQAGGGSCYGIHCFMLSYFIFAGVCMFGFLVSLVLFFRTREFYASILQRRSKQLQF
uniref:protein NUCLEAR FUSION DEFECTIVE 4-like n=1 Tax=Erigeron canadensis TaxID=72917 RepID=UPI001CB8B586|nr:protein NUCLEAR FUSION DEFECTIVE 4-like [Erigeron canadensis]